MAKNNDHVLIPKFLDMKAARKINNFVYQNTGCFLFITLPEENLLAPKPSKAGGDNYSYNVINLYKMYNDYGHYFLWFSLQESQLPLASMPTDRSSDYDNLKNDRSRVMEHYTLITKNARHVLTHGICQHQSMIPPFTNPKVSFLESKYKEILSEQKWPQSDNDWKKINRWLVTEADYVYDWITRWASLWQYCGAEKENLKRRFYYGRWEFASNRDICRSVNEESLMDKIFDGAEFHIYEETNSEITSFARAFPFQFIYDAKDYLLAAAQSHVRSQYEEGAEFWRSDKPEINLKFLCKNINFYGIENVRKQMHKPEEQAAPCPDAFKLYLEGLTGKMVTLPAIDSRKPTSGRFRRR